MKNKIVLPASLILILSGCANLSTIDRVTGLPQKVDKGYISEGKAIHLDAAQRLVYADANGICAEPTPDALQAYASSFGASGTITDKGSANISQALQTDAASIGLRTQSITLMRDHLYRICEASHNKMLDRDDVMMMLERTQDLTLGVLAIEQLTGAVAAKQVMLSGTSQADSSANIRKSKAELDQARQDESAAKQALDKATDDQKTAETTVNTATTHLATANAVSPPIPADVNTASAALKTAKSEKTDADNAFEAATTKYQEAQQVTKAILDNYNASITTATAKASGSSKSDEVPTSKPMDKDSAATIADATYKIVDRVLSKGHMIDTCMVLMKTYAKTTEAAKLQQMAPIVANCTNAINAYLIRYAEGEGSISPAKKVPGGSTINDQPSELAAPWHPPVEPIQ